MATWGGSTQGVLDYEEEEDDDEDDEELHNDAANEVDEDDDDYQSEGITQPEEVLETSSHETYTMYPNRSQIQGIHNSRESKNRLVIVDYASTSAYIKKHIFTANN